MKVGVGHYFDRVPTLQKRAGRVTPGALLQTWFVASSAFNLHSLMYYTLSLTPFTALPISVSCIAPPLITISQGQDSTLVTYGPDRVSVTGGTGPYLYTFNPLSGSTFNIGTSPVSVTVTDSSQASASCTFEVTVNRVGGKIVCCIHSGVLVVFLFHLNRLWAYHVLDFSSPVL